MRQQNNGCQKGKTATIRWHQPDETQQAHDKKKFNDKLAKQEETAARNTGLCHMTLPRY